MKIGSSNYHFVSTDLVVIEMGKSAFDKVVHACFGKVDNSNYMDTITKFENHHHPCSSSFAKNWKWVVLSIRRGCGIYSFEILYFLAKIQGG